MDNLFFYYIAIFLISYLLITHIKHKYQNLPPSPFPKLPILGHLHLLTNPNTLHRTLSKISDKYGPVVYLALGSSRPTIIVSSPSAVEECLSTNDITFANRPPFLLTELAGADSGLAWMKYGPVWKAHRRIVSTELLSNQQLKLLSCTRAEEVKFIIQRIYAAITGEANNNGIVDIGKLFKELTTNVMSRMISGKSIFGKNGDPKEVKRYNEFNQILYDSLFFAADFFPFFKYLGLEKLAQKKIAATNSFLDGFFQDMLDAQTRRNGGHCGGGAAGVSGDRNFIQILLDLEKTDNPFYSRDDTIKRLVQSLLVAGTDSSSCTLEWALALLLNNPRVLKRAKQEIDAHVGGALRLLTEDDLAHLPYLNCILKETLRMYPVGPLLMPHLSSIDCVVGGYHIPRGTMLMVNAWKIHHDPKIWEDPLEFKPERFEGINNNNNNAIRYKYLPFGTGRRACPGENLAMRFTGLTLGSLLHCFTMEKVGDIDMHEKCDIVIAKVNPLQAKFKPHKDMLELLSQ